MGSSMLTGLQVASLFSSGNFTQRGFSTALFGRLVKSSEWVMVMVFFLFFFGSYSGIGNGFGFGLGLGLRL